MSEPAYAPPVSEVPIHDVAIIGGGVVGCALFRAFALAGLDTLLIERDADLLAGASKANSAILHTGFDAPPGSLEHRCVVAGHAAYTALHERLGLKLLPTTAILAAWTEADLEKLPGILATAHQNGVHDVRALTADEVRAREPHLAPDVKGGLLVPGEGVIDPWSAPHAYALQALLNGGALLRGANVTGGEREGGVWRLATSKGERRARVVINAAGLQGDIVEAIARPSPFEIRPRKGQFVVMDKTAARLASAIILPVPNERTKGVVICRTAFGNLLVGPTAEETPERVIPTVEQEMLEGLLAQGRRMIPALADEPVTALYAGLRPATQFKDYQVEAIADQGWITVGGIRSTGLTGSLGIADHVLGLYEERFGALKPIAEPVWPMMPNLTEEFPRPWQEDGRSSIVCHCEMVTEAEIRAALTGPMPAGNIGGLKRRTRCMMGRCQGFYCTRRVMEIAAPALPGLVAKIGGHADA